MTYRRLWFFVSRSSQVWPSLESSCCKLPASFWSSSSWNFQSNFNSIHFTTLIYDTLKRKITLTFYFSLSLVMVMVTNLQRYEYRNYSLNFGKSLWLKTEGPTDMVVNSNGKYIQIYGCTFHPRIQILVVHAINF